MKSNKLFAVALALVSLSLTAANPAPAQKKAPNEDAYGGMLMKPPKGCVRYCSYQSKVSERDLMSLFLVASNPIRLRFDYKAMQGKLDMAKAAELKGDASVAIFIVDDPALPMSLLALEEKWGLVNVAKLTTDNPKTLVLLRRLDKLVTRIGTGLLGGHYCLTVPFSAMKPVFTLAELDKMDGTAIAPASLTQIAYSLRALGMSEYRPCTYEQACVEGWAPAPTNDVQREIWNDVKNPANRFKKDLPELKK